MAMVTPGLPSPAPSLGRGPGLPSAYPAGRRPDLEGSGCGLSQRSRLLVIGGERMRHPVESYTASPNRSSPADLADALEPDEVGSIRFVLRWARLCDGQADSDSPARGAAPNAATGRIGSRMCPGTGPSQSAVSRTIPRSEGGRMHACHCAWPSAGPAQVTRISHFFSNTDTKNRWS
jgi:hypothetical protein